MTPRYFFIRSAAWLGLLLGILPPALALDPTWNYAVQVTAATSGSPPQITLSWVEDTGASPSYHPSYTVSRKRFGDPAWDSPVTVPLGETSYVDRGVSAGEVYEYDVTRTFADPTSPKNDHVAHGFLASSVRAPLNERRGEVILLVEDRIASALGDRVARLRSDLIGDGWTVSQIVVSAGDSGANVRQRIRDRYYSASPRPRTLFLLGHVPIVRSGLTAPDFHEKRPMPADGFYADVDGGWVDGDGDGVYENNTLPSAVELEVGRADFYDLGGLGLGMDDVAMTARYLDKNHAFRHAEARFARRGLIGDRVGIDRGRAPAAQSYRDISAFFGPEAVVLANVEDSATDGERWVNRVHSESFLWAFGSGAGDPDIISFLGTRGEYKDATSADLVAGAMPAFTFFMGSHFVDWATKDNLQRSTLAAPIGGLGSAWTGRPNFLMHALGLGETIGYGVKLTMNNETHYYSPTNAMWHGVHIGWLGDPTLRLLYPAPVSHLGGAREDRGYRLSWQASADANAGGVRYLVYRAESAEGPFTRLTPSAIDPTSYVDAAAPTGVTYMVRALKVEHTASGVYENPSQGIFWNAENGGAPPNGPTIPDPPSSPTGMVRLAVPLLFTPRPASMEPGPRRP